MLSTKVVSDKLFTSKLFTAKECQALDRIAIEQFGIPSYELMCRAGQAAMDLLRTRWKRANNVLILCGTGNNGGDGLVLARLLKNIGIGVDVWVLGEQDKLKGDARKAYDDAQKSGVSILFCVNVDEEKIRSSLGLCAVVVDALLGTGTQGELRENLLSLVKLVNESERPVFALDNPTGLCVDTGSVLGDAIKADMTLTFIAQKPGLLTGQAADYVGDLHCATLGLDQAVFDALVAKENANKTEQSSIQKQNLESFCFKDVKHLLMSRKKTSHKGDFGHVLLVGGDLGMGGAIALAGMAALRVGAGLVSVACHPENAALVTSLQAELMCRGIKQKSDLDALIKKASVIVMGPGLGQSTWSQMIFSKIIEEKKLRVLDADALNWLANNHHYSEQWVLTPHTGEAGRLLACSREAINKHRFAASADIQKQYGGVCVLKGAGTVVCAQVCSSNLQTCGVCLDGNSGMASGGMGDVLTGILAGLIAQFDKDLSLEQITRLGVSLHSHAADCIAKVKGGRGMLASDLIPQLQDLVNEGVSRLSVNEFKE